MKRQSRVVLFVVWIVIIGLVVKTPSAVKALPGDVTIVGKVTYQPRNVSLPPSSWPGAGDIQIQLYHRDFQNANHLLDTVYTNRDGTFTFPSRLNWWGADNRRLNIYYHVITTSPTTTVTTRVFANYVFESDVTLLTTDGLYAKNFAIDSSWTYHQALWIYGDIRNAWHFVNDRYSVNGTPYNPGNVTAVWETNINCYGSPLPDWIAPCGSFAYGGILTHFIFISHDANTNSLDTVLHETAHLFMVNANGYWYTGCLTHSIPLSSNAYCAWAEGWADFLPLAVNNDSCYDLNTVTPCQGAADQDYYNLESHTRGDIPASFNWGDTVEGRVAGSLLDLYDNSAEGYDALSAGFAPIARIALSGTQTTTFNQFWNRWTSTSGQNTFLSGLGLWLNTIEYVPVRRTYLPAIRK